MAPQDAGCGGSGPFGHLLATLSAAGAGLDVQQLLDALWLARRMPPADARAPLAPRPSDGVPYQPHRGSPLPSAPPPPGHRTREPEEDTPAGALHPFRPPERHPATEAPGEGTAATPLRAPEARALRSELRLGRALRPLKQHRASPVRREFDERATAFAFAETGLPDVHLRPARDRWLDLALLVDDGVSMLLWQRLATELRALTQRLGAFRTVRAFGLHTRGESAPALRRRPFAPDEATLPARLAADPSGGTLVLVLSDGMGAAWGDGRMHRALAEWARRGPTAVVHALPPRMWDGSGVRAADWQVSTGRRGAPNTEWTVGDPVLPVPVPDPLAAWGHAPVPVLEPRPGPMGTWARLLASPGSTALLPLLRPAEARRPGAESPLPPETSRVPDPLDGLLRFRAAATPEAYRLAAHLAAVGPLSVPVMRLVREGAPWRAETSHLAEVFLGGLLHPADGTPEPPPRQRLFDFEPRTREALLDAVPATELLETERRITEVLARHAPGLAGFPTWLAHPGGGPGTLPADSRPFTTIGTRLAGHLGAGQVAGRERETRPGLESETRPELERETRPDLELETGTELERETRPGLESEVRPELERETRPGLESEVRPELERETRPGLESEVRPELERETRPGLELETGTELGPETRPDLESETRPELERATERAGEREADQAPEAERPRPPGHPPPSERPQPPRSAGEGPTSGPESVAGEGGRLPRYQDWELLLPGRDPDRVGPYVLSHRAQRRARMSAYLGRAPDGAVAVVRMPEGYHHPEQWALLHTEAEALRRMAGQGAPRLLDADLEADIPWVAEELLLGPDDGPAPSLRRHLETHEPLSALHAAAPAWHLIEAVRRCHEHGMVHGDLSVDTVFWPTGGRLALTAWTSAVIDGRMIWEGRHGPPTAPDNVHALGRLLGALSDWRGPEWAPFRDTVRQSVSDDPSTRPTPTRILQSLATCAGWNLPSAPRDALPPLRPRFDPPGLSSPAPGGAPPPMPPQFPSPGSPAPGDESGRGTLPPEPPAYEPPDLTLALAGEEPETTGGAGPSSEDVPLTGEGTPTRGGYSVDLGRDHPVNLPRVPVSYRIVVLSFEEGAGRTTTTAALGSLLASAHRQPVIAIDTVRGANTLDGRVRRESAGNGSARDLLASAPYLNRPPDARWFTSRTPSGLEILAGDARPDGSTALSDDHYRRLIDILREQYLVILTDGDGGQPGSVPHTALDLADQLVVVTGPSTESARSASAGLDRLSGLGFRSLVQRAVAVVSGVRATGGTIGAQGAVRPFLTRCRAVVSFPFDEHLAAGTELDLDRMQSDTRAALRELADLVWRASPGSGGETRGGENT
ncbi:SAV_2336 N-terminal domain-related protein [Streptomyces sp. HNM0574]|uniref:SAV_2336 N-terminal domain-related protein n=1 Tax=Streptomyces sp. HNM0574 TaxID=2714954 RepID=UPI0019D2E69E|nr:SAV_2336 N-terminal domain-related protein [Streptomyces sp. HNM0574]